MKKELTIEQLFAFREYFSKKIQEQGSKYSSGYDVIKEIKCENLIECIQRVDEELYKRFIESL